MTSPDNRTPLTPGQPTDDEVLEAFRPVPAQPSQGRRWVKILLIAAAVIAVPVAVGFYSNSSTLGVITPPLVKAQQACDPAGLGTTVGDGDKTLVVDGVGKEDTTGATVETEACILKNLGVTTAVLQHIDSTRALDGRQTDSWDRFKAAWTYHPDAGFDIVIQES